VAYASKIGEPILGIGVSPEASAKGDLSMASVEALKAIEKKERR